MKNIKVKRMVVSLAALLTIASIWAQSPEKMSYQAVIRNSNGQLISNRSIGIQISILNGSSAGNAVYVETHTAATNTNGLVSIEIGSGTVVNGDFSAIDWADGPYFIKTETDPAGGNSYTIIGRSQLISVPYALHANTASSISGTVQETDPVYSSSQAANITSGHITHLNNLSGTNTGDQDISGITVNAQAIQDTALQIRSDIPDVSGFISNETDPVFIAWDKNYTDLTNRPGILDSVIAALDTISRFYQQLTINNNELSLTNGNTVTLPGNGKVPVLTTEEIAELTPVAGDALFNSTEQHYQIYTGSEWQVFVSNCWPEPTVADAGEDQTYSDGTTMVTLDANIPDIGHGTGLWSIISGTGGTITDNTNPGTTFSGTENTGYLLQWEITTVCGSSADQVNIVFDQMPTEANAGESQLIFNGTTNATLSANTPEPGHGTGVWSIVYGEGGAITDPGDPNSTFTGQMWESYILKWSISTEAGTSSDQTVVSFGSTVSDYDWNAYYVVPIGDQVWMGGNLAVTHYNNGDPIPEVTEGGPWQDLGTAAYCWYDNNYALYGSSYGALYNYYVVERDDLCPEGWHIASKEEWDQLNNFLISNGYDNQESYAIMSTDRWSDSRGFDEFMFNAYPSGQRNWFGGQFSLEGYAARWWTGPQEGQTTTIQRAVFSNYSYIAEYTGSSKNEGFSVRCVRD